MDTQQAAQSEALMEAGGGSPADRQGCFRCAVALLTVVILALMTGYILHVFMFPPSCIQMDQKLSNSYQEAPTPTAAGKVILSSRLTESEKEGRYDIFTVNKSATYLIYGWVKLSDVTGGEVVLMQTRDNQNRTIQKRNASDTEIFFYKEVLMATDIRISINYNTKPTDSLFHMYEL